MENTSGQGKTAAVPLEIKGWNWGAFLLNVVWGLGNRTYIALLTLLPPLTIIMPFVLGFKGNEWAWRNNRWNDVAHFKRVQRTWGIVAVVVFVAYCALAAVGVTGAFYALTKSVAYQTAVTRVSTNAEAISLLGQPIKAGWPTGKVSIEGARGTASLEFSATGPKGTGTVFVEARREGGDWSFTRIALKPQGQDRQIDLR